MKYEDLEIQEKYLQDQLAALPNKTIEIIKIVLVGAIFPFVLPLMPMRTVNLSTKENYPKAVLIYGIGVFAIVILLCYKKIRDINYEKYSIEYDLEILKEKKKQFVQE